MLLERKAAFVLPSVDMRLGSLGAALVKLDFGIHPTHEVQAFKRRRRMQEFRRDRDIQEFFGVFCIALVVTLLLTFVLSAIPHGVPFIEASTWARVGWFALFCVTGLLEVVGFIITVMMMGFLGAGWKAANWVLTPFTSGWLHTGRVPEIASQRARQLSAVLPGCTFEIERLNLDPFLWAEYKDQRYCICQWDEPGFPE